ncbi:hypothetical protein [Kitasatospora sp. GP82]|uniref:hypothetical protein n=1 Tax=Kitasatospora sp. GP82 TaxID=3035089 RepID=UPI0024764813|nr:hypothetical protein [Kitasatospora sp. GP82]MDH6125319.1 hypothetical protein [Kitasatospora sp. GP82]
MVKRFDGERDYSVASASIRSMGETYLPVFCQRAAVLTVRANDVSHLRSGLRAAVLSVSVDDLYDVIIVLALLWNSAELIGVSPEVEFLGIARQAGKFGGVLVDFLKRAPEDRSLDAMQYSVRGAGKTFWYRCDW